MGIAMYEDQVGEYDWHIENVGYVQDSIFMNKKVVVASEDGVIAALNSRTGSIIWRVLPRATKGPYVRLMAASIDSVYTLSVFGTVECWDASSGSLLWSSPAFNSSVDVFSRDEYADMFYNPSQRCLQVISHNQFTFFNAESGTVLFALDPTSDEAKAIQPAYPSIDLEMLTFIHLDRTSSPSKSASSNSRSVLSGCIRSETSSCASTFTIHVRERWQGEEMKVTLEDIRVSAGPLEKGFGKVYANREAISALTSTSIDDVTFTSVHLPSNTLSQAILPNSSVKYGSNEIEVNTFEVVLEGGSVSSGISVCARNGCSVYEITFDPSNHMQLNEVLTCSSESNSRSSVISFSRSPSDFKTVKGVMCSSVRTSSTQTCPKDTCSSPVVSSLFTSDMKRYEEVKVQLESSHGLIALAGAFVHTFTSKTKSPERMFKILFVSSGGMLICASNNGVVWNREEGLSRTVGVVVQDGHVSRNEKKGYGVEELTAIPDFKARMSMQYEAMEDKLTSLVSNIRSLRSSVATLVYHALPPEIQDALFPSFRPESTRDSVNSVLFGFNKIAVQLTSRCSLVTDGPVSTMCLDGLRVIAVDLIDGSLLWSFTPNISPYVGTIGKNDLILFSARLLRIRSHYRDSHPPEISLLVSVAGANDSVLLSFNFHGMDGVGLGQHSSLGGDIDQSTIPNGVIRAPSLVAEGLGHVLGAQMLSSPLTEYLSEHAYSHHGMIQYLLVHDSTPKSATVFPFLNDMFYPDKSEVYVHDMGQNQRFISYQVDFKRVLSSHPYALSISNQRSPIVAFGLNIVGATNFNEKERVLKLKYVTPQDPVESPARVLGDDSLLLKYLNPHMVVIVSEKRQNSDGNWDHGNDVGEDHVNIDELFVTVVDTVSAEVVHRFSIMHAVAPVHVAVVENSIFTSYWNAKAQRSEISSVSLYEGMIDKYGLGPLSANPVDPVRSSFNAPPPIALQKTFALPRSVTAMHHTVTERGIANKNLVLGFITGQVYALDMRMVDPRRPLGTPTASEKNEGLHQYFPHILLSPLGALTANSTVGYPSMISSSPSHLESTSLVLTHGLDVHFTRWTPSKGFDMLASDFNKPLLTLILVGMGVAVLVLRQMNQRRLLALGWS